MTRNPLILVTLALGLVLGGCSNRSIGNKIDDQFLEPNVANAISRSHPDLTGPTSHIVVTAYNGVILLAGHQVEIFDYVLRTHGRVPPVVDSADLLAAPEQMLRALCDALGVPFSPRMLSWPPGPRETDGVWARHWYDRVERSTGFESPREPAAMPPLEGRLAAIEAQVRPMYERLREHRLRA